MTPKEWSKGAIRSHLGGAFQDFHRLRNAMLAASEPGKPVADLLQSMVPIGERIADEVRWLEGMMPIPEGLARSSRARFLAEYGTVLVQTMKALRDGMESVGESQTLAAEKFEPFGVGLLTILALEGQVKRRVV